MSEVILRTTDLKKVIGKKTIVSDITMELNKGEIFGFLGPNGAGKSTTIKMIVGLSSITEGNITVSGFSIKSHFREAMRHIGCIVENPDLYQYMSGLDNLRLFAKMYPGVGEERIREVVRIVDLEYAIGNKVKIYSLGMKQRLGIAQALLHSPDLLVLDEPTNGLDPAGIKELRELLRMLAAQTGLTVLVSSHILAEMQQMCDRVCIINKGRIVTIKTVEELTGSSKNGKNAMLFDTDNNLKAFEILHTIVPDCKILETGILTETVRAQVPKLVKALTEGGVGIYAIDKNDACSLEDIFMQLTGEEKAS